MPPPIVPRRRVNYGPIDPQESRALFLRFGLTEGDMNTRAPFWRHNRELINELHDLEAKSRRRDILVDEEVIYGFYANRIPEGVYSVGSEIKDGYPEFSDKVLKQLGWWDDLTDQEKELAEGKNWKTDLSGGIQRVAIAHGCAPFGNAKARAVVWTFPDPVPIHREPLYAPSPELVQKYPTYEDRKRFYRLPTKYGSIQAKDHSGEYPLVFTSGRLVEYEGGGEEQRSNPWLAELQQNMFVEIHPADANDRGLGDGQMVWISTPEGARIKVMTMVTRRVAPGVVWTPFHFGGWYEGQDLIDKYPTGTEPYIRGEACNTAMTYGYDSVTQMQETKVTLCKISAA